MSAFAQILPSSAIRYRDIELSPRSFAREIRYHDKLGVFAFRVSDREAERLTRVAATAGAASVMLFLFLKIVARSDEPLSALRIATEIGGTGEREIEQLLARLELVGLVRRERTDGGFFARFA